ncbi:MAG TPA: pentapeptide repeat-containing protein [Rhodopila sp.]|uniref:pentapeptide repeat-containing protein n=1 Tax=Rhodopila sp. TaxID=2480087 RepID=UPI002BA25B05|nr:pentapeptide repeat-containing protein [Rhodopila sp.]HVY15950.1 pentapeptide repeat-containing protein [Rhodopila sp.]
MPARIVEDFPRPDSVDKKYTNRHFIDERMDKAVFSAFTFEFCTFEKIGLRDAEFVHCEFKHCEFIDCYLVGGTYRHCNFHGSVFRECQFSWASFPDTQINYTRFFGGAPVLIQVADQKPRDPQNAAKFFRNLAVEHQTIGNWQEVDRLIKQSYKERERHFWYAFIGQDDHYRKHYDGSKRVRYGFRWIASKINGMVWGYGVSWASFARSLAIFGLIILPLVNALTGSLRDQSKYFWTQQPVGDVLRYLKMLYKTSAEAFLPFIPTNLLSPSSDLILPPFMVISEALLGTIFIALFASLLFRASSKGT